MNSENINTKKEIKSAWNKLNLNKPNYKKLDKDFIMKSIDTKSSLSIMEIRSRIKNELIMYLVSICLLLYGTVSGIIHSLNHSVNSSVATIFIVITIFVIAFYGFFIIRQFLTYAKIKKSRIDENSSFQQLKSNYTIIKSYLKFDKIWLAIILGLEVYLIFSYYAHISNHKFPMIYVMLLSICSFAVGLIYVDIKNKKKYGPELKHLKNTLENIQKDEI